MRRKFYTVLRGNAKCLIIVAENTRIVPLQAEGTKLPFYMVDSYPHFIDVVKLMADDRPIISLIGHEEILMTGNYSIADEAARHVQTMLEYQPTGPYMIGGCSASGIVAFETAQQMCALGREVRLLVLFDTPNPHYMREYSALHMSLNSYRDDLSKLRSSQIPLWAMMKFRKLVFKGTQWLQSVSHEANGAQDKLGPSEKRIEIARRYRPSPYPGRVLLFKRYRELTGRYLDPQFGWGEALRGYIEICHVNALDHLEIFKSEFDRATMARKLSDTFNQAVEGRMSSRHLAGMSERDKNIPIDIISKMA
jgi:thioesterase domain-containing protein